MKKKLCVILSSLIIFLAHSVYSKKKNFKLRPRIIGGNPAIPYKYPHYTFIEYNMGPKGLIVCGGTILNEYYLITAEHCMLGKKKDTFKISAGFYDILDQSVTKQTRRVEKVIFFQRPKSEFVDICLVKVDAPFIFDQKVAPANLPKQKGIKPKDGTVCTVIGFGWIKQNPPLNPQKLQEVKVPVVNRILCSKNYNGIDVVEDHEFCAGKKQGNFCKGDSGGGLFCLDRYNQFVLTGIASRIQSPCGAEKYPGIYVGVSDFLDWIKSNINKM